MGIREAIERAHQRYERGEAVEVVLVSDPLPEYGGGDPALADDIARAVGARWDS